MRWQSCLAALACLASSTEAFPSSFGSLGAHHVRDAMVSRLSRELAGAVRRRTAKRLFVDPLTTPIEVTGDHAFIPPDFANGDQRGPCPGLNALANHGYISRHGVTTLAEVTAAINEVWGMGLDISAILAVMGTVFVGNPLSPTPGFSIGGVDPDAQNIAGNLFGLLGTPRGLEGSHNIIEGDSSNTRADLYVTGDASTMVLSQFADLYAMSSGEGDYNMDLFAQRASLRFQETVETNPNFYYGPFTGLIARNAGYLFAARLFANYSRENPEGVLTKATLRSIFGVRDDNGTLAYHRGCERIPENWYRTPVDYTLLQFNLDLLALVARYPRLASIGGNMGSVNSFAGLDLGDVTGGVLNAAKLLEGNNLLCFVFEVIKTVAPNSMSTLFRIIKEPLAMLTDTISAAALHLDCPAFTDLTVDGKDLQDGLEGKFPGAKEAGSVL